MFHRRLYPALAPVFHIAHAADKETSSDVQKPYIARPDMANWRGKIRIGHDDASRIPLATVYSKEESASRRVPFRRLYPHQREASVEVVPLLQLEVARVFIDVVLLVRRGETSD